MFSERVIPLLNVKQEGAHYDFSLRYVNNWYQGKGKYLLLHYDEKWFWGMLLRKTGKKFDGYKVEAIKCYHKNHISKQWE